MNLYCSSLARRGLQGKGTVQFVNTFPHRIQAEPMLFLTCFNRKPLSIVTNSEADTLLGCVQNERDLAGVSVTHRIRERFLSDTQQSMLSLWWEFRRSNLGG